ncbi:hypothetical protein [Ornithinimicrobium kibberense]|uniref:hypothetical protein n=1 Tax=Ornithinimicrobium kibberense TaxID=282060 RepID=UPI003605EB3D
MTRKTVLPPSSPGTAAIWTASSRKLVHSRVSSGHRLEMTKPASEPSLVHGATSTGGTSRSDTTTSSGTSCDAGHCLVLPRVPRPRVGGKHRQVTMRSRRDLPAGTSPPGGSPSQRNCAGSNSSIGMIRIRGSVELNARVSCSRS